ncbi:MAG TPA: amino acid permease [Steroidobacteraceae bacterium]|nr:amino acid permease [Steroidobacteraceae bacterium]
MSQSTSSQLPRRLGLWTSVAVVMGITIGSGIFKVPSSVAQSVDSVGAISLLWVLGGILSLCLALSLAELASMFPRPGGAFVFLRETYGPVVAFVFGWTFLIVNPASTAGIAIVFAEYLAHFMPLGDHGRRVAAAVMIALITLANYRSVSLAAGVQNLATSAKALALAALALLIFAFGRSSQGALAAPISFEVSNWGGFGVALIGVLFTYEGAAAFTALSGEVRDPARNLRRVLMYGVGLVTALYLLVNAAYLYVLPLEAMRNSSALVAADAMARVAGPVAANVIAALVVLSTFGAVAATSIADPRVFYSMTQEGLFFRVLGKAHPRFETPHIAIVVAGVLAILWVSSRTFEQLTAVFILGLYPFYALTALGVVVLRVRQPQLERPYRTWGYPIVPFVVAAAAVLVLVNSFIEQRMIFLVNVAISLSGIPLYYAWRAFTRRKS